MNVEKLINAIDKRPGMYVCPINIESIYNFICGYLVGRKNQLFELPPDPIDAEFLASFGKWSFRWIIKNKYSGYKFESFAWFKMFQSVTQDDNEARELFFLVCQEFFECFRNENDDYWNSISY